jgi:hypothetical protein
MLVLDNVLPTPKTNLEEFHAWCAHMHSKMQLSRSNRVVIAVSTVGEAN